MSSSKKKERDLAANRKAFHDYAILERFEAGMELLGTEVKSIRNGAANLRGSHVQMRGEDAILVDLHIPPYENAGAFPHVPDRPRRLLLHRKQIDRLKVHLDQRGHALIPLRMYSARGRIKLEIGLCKGKRHADKREALRRKTADREAARAMATGGR
ncbi:MAG: SsrA-binding protein SmpB [Lentisphaerae bacterium]|nr:SsrA-binding protein SmpB [Lentisphaerota bacterium]